MVNSISVVKWVDLDDDGEVELGFLSLDAICPKCYSGESSLIIMESKNVIIGSTSVMKRLHIRCMCCQYKTTGIYTVEM